MTDKPAQSPEVAYLPSEPVIRLDRHRKPENVAVIVAINDLTRHLEISGVPTYDILLDWLKEDPNFLPDIRDCFTKHEVPVGSGSPVEMIDKLFYCVAVGDDRYYGTPRFGDTGAFPILARAQTELVTQLGDRGLGTQIKSIEGFRAWLVSKGLAGTEIALSIAKDYADELSLTIDRENEYQHFLSLPEFLFANAVVSLR